jgi:hypothetical protein
VAWDWLAGVHVGLREGTSAEIMSRAHTKACVQGEIDIECFCEIEYQEQRAMICPFCGFRVKTLREETDHMKEAHNDIVEQRLIRAGFVRDPVTKEWVDTLASGD